MSEIGIQIECNIGLDDLNLNLLEKMTSLTTSTSFYEVLEKLKSNKKKLGEELTLCTLLDILSNKIFEISNSIYLAIERLKKTIVMSNEFIDKTNKDMNEIGVVLSKAKNSIIKILETLVKFPRLINCLHSSISINCTDEVNRIGINIFNGKNIRVHQKLTNIMKKVETKNNLNVFQPPNNTNNLLSSFERKINEYDKIFYDTILSLIDEYKGMMKYIGLIVGDSVDKIRPFHKPRLESRYIFNLCSKNNIIGKIVNLKLIVQGMCKGVWEELEKSRIITINNRNRAMNELVQLLSMTKNIKTRRCPLCSHDFHDCTKSFCTWEGKKIEGMEMCRCTVERFVCKKCFSNLFGKCPYCRGKIFS